MCGGDLDNYNTFWSRKEQASSLRPWRSLPSKPYVSRAKPHCKVIPLDRRGKSSVMTFTFYTQIIHEFAPNISQSRFVKTANFADQTVVNHSCLYRKYFPLNNMGDNIVTWLEHIARQKKIANAKTLFRSLSLPVSATFAK